ncbi:Do family serine endopeptidase [Chitinivorax sp. PXF-14]|uniref:Do family serine endopeptidase n=1 Tax=Chitinivorax sp. PXF-14 TaxID=3230488 RepID=UPI003467E1CC
MLKKLWLIFAQSATVALALWFVVSLAHPDWLGRREPQQVVTLREASQPNSVAAPRERGPVSYRDAAAKAQPAVVNIYTSKEVKVPRHPLANDPFFRQFFGDRGMATQRASSLGSGVIVSDEGYIVTNHHVVKAADEIEVALADGRTASAKLVGTDPETDLAVIRVGLDKLPVMTLADSDKLAVGDVTLAIGNPFGVGQTVTMGIVSALGRSQLGINTFENFIQTDAAINPGNSGGALIDVDGNLVGINTAIYSQSGGSLGIGFAIPANSVRQIMEQIIRNGTVTRGWIGVEMRPLNAELAVAYGLKQGAGVLVSGIVRDGPAHQAGLLPGDVLVEVARQPVGDVAGAMNRIAALSPGTRLQLGVMRDGQRIEVESVVARRPHFSRNGLE